MRVTLVTHYFPAHGGGVERVAGLLAERLASSGVASIVWHASDCDAPPSSRPALTCVPARSCNIIERRFGFPYPLWTPAALMQLVQACRRADVVHLHDCLYLPNVVAFVAARLARRPVLVTQHIGHVPYGSRLLHGLHSAANRILGRWVLGGADRVIFESESVRKYFSRFVQYRAAAQVVQNGVDTKTFSPATAAERRELRARVGAPAGAPLLLFLGRFVEKKGLRVLRELTQLLPDAHWLFAGWGPLDPSHWSRPNVRVVHSPAAHQLTALYQAADLLVLPSVGEGFPLSVQEAMACGTPALVGAETASGCPEAGGLLLGELTGTPDTAVRWAARLRSLLDSPSTLEGMRSRVAAFAREHWTWERCAGRYAEVLRACMP